MKMSQPSLNKRRSCLVLSGAKLFGSVTAAIAVHPLSRPGTPRCSPHTRASAVAVGIVTRFPVYQPGIIYNAGWP